MQAPPPLEAARDGPGQPSPTGPCLYAIVQLPPDARGISESGHIPLLCRSLTVNVECHVANAFLVCARGFAPNAPSVLLLGDVKRAPPAPWPQEISSSWQLPPHAGARAPCALLLPMHNEGTVGARASLHSIRVGQALTPAALQVTEVTIDRGGKDLFTTAVVPRDDCQGAPCRRSVAELRCMKWLRARSCARGASPGGGSQTAMLRGRRLPGRRLRRRRKN